MKPTVVVRLAALSVFCFCAYASSVQHARADMTVGMLSKLCKSKAQPDEAMCGPYLLGVMDSFKASAKFYGAKLPFCYPKNGLSAQDMSLAFQLWASTNPGEEQRTAIAGIIDAMTERFPCRP